jgi:hypothetical protein
MQKFTKVDEGVSCELHVTNKKKLLSHEIPRYSRDSTKTLY